MNKNIGKVGVKITKANAREYQKKSAEARKRNRLGLDTFFSMNQIKATPQQKAAFIKNIPQGKDIKDLSFEQAVMCNIVAQATIGGNVKSQSLYLKMLDLYHKNLEKGSDEGWSSV